MSTGKRARQDAPATPTSECAICLQPIDNKSSRETTTHACGLHTFHSDCICEWLQHNRSCPVCRFKKPRYTASDDGEVRPTRPGAVDPDSDSDESDSSDDSEEEESDGDESSSSDDSVDHGSRIVQTVCLNIFENRRLTLRVMNRILACFACPTQPNRLRACYCIATHILGESIVADA